MAAIRREAIKPKPGDKNPLFYWERNANQPVDHIEPGEFNPYWNPQGDIQCYYGVQPFPVQYQQFQYNPAVQQGWAGGIQLQPGHATVMQPYWTTTAAQQQYAAQQLFPTTHAQQYATQHQQIATQQQCANQHQQVATQYHYEEQYQQVATHQQQAAKFQQKVATKQQKVATKHQQGAKQQEDEEKQREEKTGTTKTIEERLEEMKQTLDKEREEFSLKLKQQTRRVTDLEIKDKHQQNEIKEQTKARELAEDMWKKIEEEKNALDAMKLSLEKEGGKINRVLLKTERDLSKAQEKILKLEADDEALRSNLAKLKDELSQEFVALRVTYNELQERLQVEELTASKTIHGLEDEVAYYKSSYQKTTEDLGIANQEQRSLARRCELWKKSSREKDLVCERAEKDKAVLSKKIQSEKAANIELQENNETLKDELAASKKQNVLLMQEVELLKEQNYNLRYYGGVIGKFRRMKRFIVNAFRRFSS